MSPTKRRQLPYQETYQFRGRTMSYRVLGEGQPVILLHGSMMSDPWDGFEKILAKRFKVYLPDLPGFGASDAVAGAKHDTDLFAEAFGAFVKSLKLEKAPVIALSLGTVVAAKAAAAGAVGGKLIFVGAPGKILGWQSRGLQLIPLPVRRRLIRSDWVKLNVLGRALRANIGIGKVTPREVDDFVAKTKTTDPRSLVDGNYVGEIEKDFPRALSRIQNPIIFLYGELDAQKGRLKEAVRPVVIPGGGHNLFRTSPEAILKHLTEIL